MSKRQVASGIGPVRAVEVAGRSAATRDALIVAARRLFVEQGYFNTSAEQIVIAAGVGTRGALYHHFADKRALFLAVFGQVQAELMDVAGRIAEGDAISRLRAGLIALLEASLTPEVQRILLIDGPAVLGAQDQREDDERHGLTTMRSLLRQAVAEGVLAPLPIDVMSHFLLAGTRDAARFIAAANDPLQAKGQAVGAVNRILAGLIASG